MKSVRNILVTMGDPAGISGEVVVKAFAAIARPKTQIAKQVRKLLDARPTNLYVVGDANVLARASRITRMPMQVDLVDAFSTKVESPRHIRLFGLSQIGMKGFRFGAASYGREQLGYLDFAIEKARRKEIAAIVTGPVTKEAVAAISPGFVGHTGYLAEQLGVTDERMAFFTPDYLLVLQTTHVPLAEVSKNLSRSSIATTIAMLAAAGRKYYGKKLPVAVLGLNPHAGEHGLLGSEEESIIGPAMEDARRAGWACDGPFPADSFFISRVKGYKLIVAMYHDQGLVAVKPAFPRVSVNVTLGLPVVRTSVDHGSGYDIAGKNKADETSMLYAIKAALELTKS